MTKDDGAGPYAEAFEAAHALGIAEERDRLRAIICSASADGKRELAHYVAFKTDMSAADAITALRLAPEPPKQVVQEAAFMPAGRAGDQEFGLLMAPDLAGAK